MYDDVDEHGRHRYTVGQIAQEFGVSCPAVYRYLQRTGPPIVESSGERRVRAAGDIVGVLHAPGHLKDLPRAAGDS